MKRKVKTKVQGFRTKDGAGVSLVRVLGHDTVEEFDPILMLDSFDSENPEEYTAGFPMHPHRGIETISYVAKGGMIHRDSLGNEEGITDGEVQWMNAGSGIIHEENIPVSDRLLGVQLWLNLPAQEKMSAPGYWSVKKENIPEITIPGGKVRLLAGEYQGHYGHQGEHLPLDYYDIQLAPHAEFTHAMNQEASVMVFTLLGEIFINEEQILEKTAVKLTEGDRIHIINGDQPARILYIASKALKEPVAWAGPIVMNTQEELRTAFSDLENNTFIQESVKY